MKKSAKITLAVSLTFEIIAMLFGLIGWLVLIKGDKIFGLSYGIYFSNAIFLGIFGIFFLIYSTILNKDF